MRRARANRRVQDRKAKKANVVKKTVANGSIVPRKEILIKPVVSGIIRELYVEAGSR
jgi:HlyD family secretion protein